MKVFIVLAVFVAAASASLVASPVVGYNSYGLNAGVPLVSGVRTLSPIGAQYVSPIASRVVSPIGYAAPQYVAGVRSYQPYGARYVSPVAARYISPYARVVSPVVSNVVAPSLYSNYGSGLYGAGYLAKKV